MKKWWILTLFVICVCVFAGCGQGETVTSTEVEGVPEPDPEPIVPKTVQEAFEIKDEIKTEAKGVWEGYPAEAFDVFLKKSLSDMFEGDEATTMKNCEVVVVEGWNCEGFLDESSVGEGNSAVSYIADMIVNVDGDDINRGLKIYAELKADGTLNVMGAESYEANMEYGQVYDAEETLGLLEELKSYMKVE